MLWIMSLVWVCCQYRNVCCCSDRDAYWNGNDSWRNDWRWIDSRGFFLLSESMLEETSNDQRTWTNESNVIQCISRWSIHLLHSSVHWDKTSTGEGVKLEFDHLLLVSFLDQVEGESMVPADMIQSRKGSLEYRLENLSSKQLNTVWFLSRARVSLDRRHDEEPVGFLCTIFIGEIRCDRCSLSNNFWQTNGFSPTGWFLSQSSYWLVTSILFLLVHISSRNICIEVVRWRSSLFRKDPSTSESFDLLEESSTHLHANETALDVDDHPSFPLVDPSRSIHYRSHTRQSNQASISSHT